MNYETIRKFILSSGEDNLVYKIVCLQDTIKEKINNTLYDIVLQNETISEKDRLKIISELTFIIEIETHGFSSILGSTLTRYTKEELTDDIIDKIISQIIFNFKEVVLLIEKKVNQITSFNKPSHQKVKRAFYNEIVKLEPSDFEKHCSVENVREKIFDIRHKLYTCYKLPDLISIPKFNKEGCSKSRCQFMDDLQEEATKKLWIKTRPVILYTLYKYDNEEIDDVLLLFFIKNQTVLLKETYAIIYSEKTLKQKQKTYEKLLLSQTTTMLFHFLKYYIKDLKLKDPNIREDVWTDLENYLTVKFNNIKKLKLTKDQPLKLQK